MTTGQLDALADALAEKVAARVLEHLAEQIADHEPAEPFIDASEVARRLNLSRNTVYELADELGAVRIGDGEKPRLRFDPRVIESLGASETPQPKRNGNGNGARRRRPQTAELLPIKEREA